MKLNFWQKIGAVALVVALIVLFYKESAGPKPTPSPALNPAAEPVVPTTRPVGP